MTPASHISIFICIMSISCLALNNGVGLTPPLGYNTWNDYNCNIDAQSVMEVADKMVEYGLLQAGYEYLNIDDCWAIARAENGTLLPDPTRFPNGMKAVADYVHSKGLKFGIYTDRGNQTCKHRPGSGGHEYLDADTFASWGVDYVKEDSCNATIDQHIAFEEYAVMRDALNQTGRDIYFSLCGWRFWYAPVGWGLGNGWRINPDCNNWPSIVNATFVNQNLSAYARPGGWNDPDMLMGSNPLAAVYVTQNQSRTQFNLWSVMAAPLLIGSNMVNMTAFDLETYTNSEVIAIDQDRLGVQGTVIWSSCDTNIGVPPCQQLWARPLADGAYALCAVNYDVSEAAVVCDAACFQAMNMQQGSVRDVWLHEELGVFDSLSIDIAADGGSRLFRIYSTSSL